ncbi:MAG: hypothetical protein AAF772_05485 [Acidobacteriota bacterium]
MITGYNTDVRYSNLTLHVQTEDKGTGNPYIESLIYFGGQVMVAKRASYADLLTEGKGEDEITALMDHQHRMMIKAIRAGKFDDKIRAFAPEKAKHLGQPPSTGEVAAATSGDGGPPSGEYSSETAADLKILEDSGRTLDQVILDYLTSEAEQEQLVLVLENDVHLTAGAQAELLLRTRSSKSGQPVTGAKVQAKMISTFGGPRTLGNGETDDDGLLRLPIEVPAVDRGTAALIISAASAIGQAELKHLL